MEKNDKNSARGAELQTLQREPCGYFLHETNQANGLVIDKTAPNWPSSIAATGLALAFRAQSGAHRSHDRELSYWHVVATDEKLSSSRDRATARASSAGGYDGRQQIFMASEFDMKKVTAPLSRQMSDQQLQRALSRWDNEGGAGACGTDLVMKSGDTGPRAPPLKNAELVRLQVRVIALENLLIALLAGASDEQLALAREMADYISPRQGFTHHGLTIHAAGQMIHLVERAGRLG